jgi:lysophospholipase L1-like esterase
MSSGLGSHRGLLSAVLLALGVLISSKASAAIKVSCIGASNFSGDGSSTGHHVPDELGIALGPNYVVKNLGISGTVMLFQGDLPYWNGQPGDLPHLKPALDSAPDIAIFWFGGNDAKAQNWTTHKDEFIPNYEETLRRFQALPSKPKLFIFKSMVIHDVEGIPKTVLEMEVLPKIDVISADTGAIVVPYHDAFINHPEYFPDGVHPNNAGTLAIGKFLKDIVLNAMNTPPTPDGGTPMDGGAGGTSGTTGAGGGAAGVGGAGTAGSSGAGTAGSTGASGDSGAGTAGSTGASGAAGSPVAGSGTAGSPPGVTHAGNAGCALAAGEVGSTSAGLSLVLAALFAARARRRRR